MATPAQPWWIYFVPRCSYTRPEPKDKLVVIVCRDDYPRGFLINTSVDPWIRIDPGKLASQVRITVDEHPSSLDHDSYVDCLDLYRFEDFELSQPREKVSANAKSAIIAAVGQSKTIVRRYGKLITGG